MPITPGKCPKLTGYQTARLTQKKIVLKFSKYTTSALEKNYWVDVY